MAGTLKRLAGPAYLLSVAADLYAPPGTGIYHVIRQIHVANVSGTVATFTLYVGASGGSAGGTELEKATPVAANTDWDRYFQPGLKLTATEFLSGLASASSALVIIVMGELVAA
jgi:hypothetical protein